MTSNGSEPNRDAAADRDHSADWLYFGSPDDEAVASDPYAAGASAQPDDTAMLQTAPNADDPPTAPLAPVDATSMSTPVDATSVSTPATADLSADLRPTQPLPAAPAQPAPARPGPNPTPSAPAATTMMQQPALGSQWGPPSTGQAEASPLAPGEARRVLLREVVTRGARRVGVMLLLTVCVTWLSGGSPQALPVAVVGIALALLTLAAEVGAWWLSGRPETTPMLPPTRLSWLAGAAALVLFVTPGAGGAMVWLVTFAAGYLAGVAAEWGLERIPEQTSRPVLGSRPLTLGLTLLCLGLAPTLQSIAGSLLGQLNQWAMSVVSWVMPTMPAPWPWHSAASWLLAVVTAAFLTRGPWMAQAPLQWKGPIFGGALVLIVWGFLAHPFQTLVFALVWVVMALLSLGRR